MQPGKREVNLRLGACRPRDAAPRGMRGQIIQQRGLARSCLTAQDQHPAVTRLNHCRQPVQHLTLATSATQR
jgi:hypothetical protein